VSGSRLIHDLTNRRFSRLSVIKHVGKGEWACRCKCGRTKVVTGQNLLERKTRSCGCYSKEYLSRSKVIHGLGKHRLYYIWAGMKDRCYNKNNTRDYPRYGGRGITVCHRWRNHFLSFYLWALSHGYEPWLTLDRSNNDGRYSPENCCWATRKQQALNRQCQCGCKYCC